ncbi:ABC transporter ATP-binding protein [Lactobacillus delbrueckii]|uniref:ABC transporter ATP-binding protein n=1 Tax=Lactobacillus delbrueckii TaxID=1584 RepID=UPI0022E4FB6E|nr:ATP-binding cassette domain-containing protein [Lactobacillus delbrueckii]
MTKVIEVSHLGKKYGQRTIFKDVSFAVERGEFVAIVGPSGSGKSTLLNMLGLLEAVDQGEIKLLGKLVPKVNSRQATKLRRQQLNYLFQSFALIQTKTVEENLLLAMAFVKKSKREKQKEIDQVLASLDLSKVKQSKVQTLSGGEQQRCALARAILKPGEIVLADEPTGALDAKRAQAAFKQLLDLRSQQGKTVVLVTHNLAEAAQADRVIDLEKFV